MHAKVQHHLHAKVSRKLEADSRERDGCVHASDTAVIATLHGQVAEVVQLPAALRTLPIVNSISAASTVRIIGLDWRACAYASAARRSCAQSSSSSSFRPMVSTVYVIVAGCEAVVACQE